MVRRFSQNDGPRAIEAGSLRRIRSTVDARWTRGRTGYDLAMSTKILFGFHAVTVRLKTAPASVTEIHVDSTRRDARMRQFVQRAQEAGAKVHGLPF